MVVLPWPRDRQRLCPAPGAVVLRRTARQVSPGCVPDRPAVVWTPHGAARKRPRSRPTVTRR
jgi:hypothetical protein